MTTASRGGFTVHDVEQRSPEWFALREGRLTGSIFGGALDVNEYETSHRRSKKIVNGDEFKGNMHTKHGQRWEDTACDIYAKRFGAEVESLGFVTPDGCDYLGVSPDGIVRKDGLSPGLVEIKCPSTKPTYNGVPIHYMCQVQGNMHVLDLEWAHFIVFKPQWYGRREFAFMDRIDEPLEDWRMEVWRVEGCSDFQEALLDGLAWFQDYVGNGTVVPRGVKNPRMQDLKDLNKRLSVELDLELSVRPGCRRG